MSLFGGESARFPDVAPRPRRAAPVEGGGLLRGHERHRHARLRRVGGGRVRRRVRKLARVPLQLSQSPPRGRTLAGSAARDGLRPVPHP